MKKLSSKERANKMFTKFSKNIIKAFAILLCGIASCYQPRLGCLDFEASNFDAISDEECEMCCIYPSISLKFSHELDGKAITFKDTFTNDLNSRFKIIEQRFYISGIKVYSKQKKYAYLTKSTFNFLSGNKEKEIDFGFVENVQQNLPFNNIKATMKPDSLEFLLGMEDEFDKVNQKNLSASSPLSVQKGMYTADKRYLSYYLKIIGGSDLKDTMIVESYEDVQIVKKIKNVINKSGFPLDLPIKANYSALTNNVNFNASKQEIQAKIKSNLSKFLE